MTSAQRGAPGVSRERKARALELAGQLVGAYMARGPFKAAGFVAYPKHAPLGIRALRGFPVEWWEEVKVPGFVVKRVGEYGVQIY